MFQPRNGSIGMRKNSMNNAVVPMVSTPQRFDWNSTLTSLDESFRFNPATVRLELVVKTGSNRELGFNPATVRLECAVGRA